jgi:PBP1b-binding outer membrane lipoprotein LpoB
MTGWSRFKQFGSVFLILAVCLILAGCGGGSGSNPRVTKENYDKIENGMSEAKLVEILGPPSDVNTPPNQPNMKGLTWKNGNNMINVTLKDNKLEIKTSQFVK